MALTLAPASAAPSSAIRSALSDWEPSRREPPIPSTLTAAAEVTLSRLTPLLRWRTTIWDGVLDHTWTRFLLTSNVREHVDTAPSTHPGRRCPADVRPATGGPPPDRG